MRIHALRNPAGGTRSTRLAAAQAIGRLRGAGHDVIELTGTSPQQSSERLATAIEAGTVERLLVAGGDGLVNLAIQHLATTDIHLIIAPTGTGNDFAAALGVDGDSVDEAIERAAQPVDLLRVTTDTQTTWVASIVIAGFPAAINARANRMDMPLGQQVYTIAALLEFPSFRRTPVDLEIDGRRRSLDSAMLAIGNTALFGGGMLACPDARPNDGLVHVTSIEQVGRLGIVPHLIARAGGSADRPEVLRDNGREVMITSPGIPLWGDGEPLADTPAKIEIVPQALRVKAPTVE